MRFRLNVNGQPREADVPLGTTLLSVLRDDLALTAARYGCGQGACGSCYVLSDGRAIASCMTRIEEAAGKKITTLEGLANGGELHPIQRAFIEEDAMQCGYCISGMLISGAALLAEKPHPSEGEI